MCHVIWQPGNLEADGLVCLPLLTLRRGLFSRYRPADPVTRCAAFCDVTQMLQPPAYSGRMRVPFFPGVPGSPNPPACVFSVRQGIWSPLPILHVRAFTHMRIELPCPLPAPVCPSLRLLTQAAHTADERTSRGYCAPAFIPYVRRICIHPFLRMTVGL